jgi:hypothetical protein
VRVTSFEPRVGNELVEEDPVVVPEAEAGHARHVLVEWQWPACACPTQWAVHGLGGGVEWDRKRPGEP